MSTENCTGIRTFCVASPIFTLPTIVAVYMPGAVPAGTVSRKATGVSVPFVTFVPFGSANHAAAADFTPTASFPLSTTKLALTPFASPGRAPEQELLRDRLSRRDDVHRPRSAARSRKPGVVAGVYATTPCVSASSAAGAEMRP